MILEKRKLGKINLKFNFILIQEINSLVLLGITTDESKRIHKKSLISNCILNVELETFINKKTGILCNAFIHSQFNYAPIITMFDNKTDNHKISINNHKSTKSR